MALINLKTNLKSLKYGADRPGYGNSGQPYIQTNLPGVLDGSGNTDPLFRIQSTGNLDYPIRGGGVTFSLGTQTYTLSSQVDKTRIKKFFEDSPRGNAFIQKQIGLQLSNPKIQTGNTLSGFNQSSPLPGILENTRVYNSGLNTSTQVGVQGSGAHAMRHGLVPFNILQKHYYDIVNNENIVEGGHKTNRLVILNNLKMTNTSDPIISTSNITSEGINIINTLGISFNKNILFQYLGGPGSVYGVGSTTIKRATDTTKLVASGNQMVYDQLRAESNSQESVSNRAPSKFKTIRDQNGNWNPKDSLEYRFYTKEDQYKVDKLNRSLPKTFDNSQAPWEDQTVNNDDIIKFVFEALSNDDTSKSTAIFFRAFLTSGITDNHSAELNSFKYTGRGETFYTYQGFNRSISFSFKVAAMSELELIPMYTRVNELMGQVYPDYSTGGIMRAPVVRVTIGDYLNRVPGFIENITATVDNGTSWEVRNNAPYKGLNDNLAQLPHAIDIAVTFKPILDILPQRRKIDNSAPYVPLILNNPIKNTSSNTNISQAIVEEIPGVTPENNNVDFSKFPKIETPIDKINKINPSNKTKKKTSSKVIPKNKNITVKTTTGVGPTEILQNTYDNIFLARQFDSRKILYLGNDYNTKDMFYAKDYNNPNRQ
jgi:hypothetical protein